MDYYKQKAWLDKLSKTTENDVYIHSLKSSTYANQLTISVLKHQRKKYLEQIDKLDDEKKEWLEYMTSWFHEIKTPIAISRMIYESEKNLNSLEEEMDRIEFFVEQALYVSRLHDFHKDYLIQEVALDHIVKEAIKMNIKSFLTKKIKLKLELDSFNVITDKKALLFIINQLLSNALKYTKNEDKITISVMENRLIVNDTGRGISSEDLPRVFEKGFTGKNGRQHYSSTGMGLYLAKNLTEKLGHDLHICSELNKFTEAMIVFKKTESLYDF
ncbi:sensor histidine kinase [Heyndrickxia sporothermodurans]